MKLGEAKNKFGRLSKNEKVVVLLQVLDTITNGNEEAKWKYIVRQIDGDAVQNRR